MGCKGWTMGVQLKRLVPLVSADVEISTAWLLGTVRIGEYCVQFTVSYTGGQTEGTDMSRF